jgi:hypothetical protein
MFFRYAPRYVFVLVACVLSAPTAFATEPVMSTAIKPQAASTTSIKLDVFKSPTCTCCEKWVANLETNGFSSTVHDPADLTQEKRKRGVALQYQSCHTAASTEGYVFEGHVPAIQIKRFLAEKPKNALGLAVPGMPAGGPGMEMGDRFSPYDILLLNADGSSSVYARINSIHDQ